MKRYIIKQVSDITLRDVNMSTSNSVDDMRRSIDGSKAIIEIKPDVPDWAIDGEILSINAIMDKIQNTEEWEYNDGL